jgi:hypothetical protein
MTTIPFKHLSLPQVREYLQDADIASKVPAFFALSPEAQVELQGLALFGQSSNSFDYEWHLEHIRDGGHHTKCSKIAVRRGIEKLGLTNELSKS